MSRVSLVLDRFEADHVSSDDVKVISNLIIEMLLEQQKPCGLARLPWSIASTEVWTRTVMGATNETLIHKEAPLGHFERHCLLGSHCAVGRSERSLWPTSSSCSLADSQDSPLVETHFHGSTSKALSSRSPKADQ